MWTESSDSPLNLLGFATKLAIIGITTGVLAHTSDSKVSFSRLTFPTI
jgi:hypothetical protein